MEYFLAVLYIFIGHAWAVCIERMIMKQKRQFTSRWIFVFSLLFWPVLVLIGIVGMAWTSWAEERGGS